MKILAWIAAILLLLGLVVLTLPFSSVGTRLLVNGLNQSGMLRVEYAAGTLVGDLELHHLSLQLDGVALQLQGVGTRLDIDCFWRSAFCFERLDVASLRLEVASGEEAAAEVAQPQLIEVPFVYRAPALAIAQLQVAWPGGSWQQAGLRADVRLEDSVLTVNSALIDSPRLTVTGGDDAEAGYPGFAPPAVFMPLVLAINELEISAGAFLLGEQQQQIDRLSLAGAWQAYDLQLTRLTLHSPQLGEASVAGELSFDGNWPLSVAADARLAGSDNEWLQDREFSLSAQGDLQQLLVEVGAAGEPALALEMSANLVAPDLPFEGSANARWPENTSLGQLTGAQGELSRLVLQGPVAGQFEGSLLSQRFRLSAEARGLGYEQLQLEASASLDGNELELRSVQITDLASNTRISARGQLSWGAEWALAAELSSPGLALPALEGDSPGNLAGSLKLSLEGQEQDWALRWRELDLAGEYRGLPALAAGAGGINSSLQLLPGATEISANGAELTVQAEEGRDSARLDFQLDDLGRWIAGARGRVELLGQGQLAREQLRLQGAAEGVLIQGVELGRVLLELDYDRAGQQLGATLQVPEIGSAGYQLRNVVMALSGSFSDHRLQLSSAGDIEGVLAVQGSWTGEGWEASLQPAVLATSSGEWRLDEAVPVEWSTELSRLSLAAHCWHHSEFRLCAEPASFADSGNLNLELSGDVRAFNGLLPRGLRVRGQLDANLDMAWAPDERMQLEAAVRARDMRTTRFYGMGERVSVDWQAIDLLLARQDDESLAVNGAVMRDNRQVLSLQGLLPATAEGEVSGRVELRELQLAVFAPWVTELSELGGSVSGELDVSGAVSNPLVRGALRLRDGRMVAVANPTALADLALDLQFDGQVAELSGTGSLGDGELALQGRISTDPQLQVQLSISGERHQVLLPPASEMLVSEELTLVMTEALLDVRGEVKVLEGVLRHEELPAGSVGLSRQVVVVDTQGKVIAEERPFDLSADIWLRIRDRFQIEGDGLRATLGGDLHVVAVPGEDPQVFGNLNLVGGELEAYRQRLQIRSGTIAFSGPVANPALDVVAERDIRSDNVTVGARLQGRLDEPVLEVYSDPVMSQGDAMSYLVRGRGLDAGAGADGTALALSVGASVVNRSGIVNELNRLPLISDVAFGASGAEDDTAATVSGYVGSRLYLSFGRGLYQPVNVLTARLYLQSRLWLEVVSELENSADLYYSFDID